jgi:hypothetical protein
MTVSESLAPIAHEYALPRGAEDAFETYVGRIGEWWDPRYTANAETLETVTIEPRVGGRVYATHTEIGEDEWGAVTVWEPGRRLVHTFTLAQDPAYPSEAQWSSSPTTRRARCGSPTAAGRRRTQPCGRSSGTGALSSTGTSHFSSPRCESDESG